MSRGLNVPGPKRAKKAHLGPGTFRPRKFFFPDLHRMAKCNHPDLKFLVNSHFWAIEGSCKGGRGEKLKNFWGDVHTLLNHACTQKISLLRQKLSILRWYEFLGFTCLSRGENVRNDRMGFEDLSKQGHTQKISQKAWKLRELWPKAKSSPGA